MPSPPVSEKYHLVPLAVFAFFILCFALYPESPLRTHALIDTDDYMRLNEVINWLQSAHPFGDGWFDYSHPRLSPGENPIVHWSRLVDLPIAAIMLPFIAHFGMQNAALIASFIVPPLLFAVLLMLLPLAMRPLVGWPRARFATAFLLFAPITLMNFSPGRVDHHAWQIIIATLGIVVLQRCVLCPRGWKWSIVGGIAFACALWIGTEALPWIILLSAGIAFLASLRGDFALRNAAIFGIVFFFAVADIMPIALHADQFGSRALSWFSGADFIFSGLIAAALTIGWLLGRRTNKAWLRVALMVALGAMAGVLFLYFVPDLLIGAYADYNTFFNDTLVGNIGEAKPLAPALIPNRYIPATYTATAILFLRMAFLPIFATLITIWQLLRTASRTRRIWFIHALFLVPALILTLFWQLRIMWFLQVFSIAPLLWFSLRSWRCIETKFEGRARFVAEAAFLLLIAPLPCVLIPAALGHASLYPDVMLFVASRPHPVCSLTHPADFLNDAYGDRPRVILSGTNEGPELLFRTQHSVLAAPYNVDGNRDAFDFFNAREERLPVRIIANRHVELVLVCRNIPPFYAGLASFKDKFNASFSIGSDGRLHMQSNKAHPTLIERLVQGDIPAWLKPVPIPLDGDYLLFELKLE